jgi:HNH endonuclease
LRIPAWPEVLAEICHIYGLKPDSPRYVPGMTVEEVNAYENLLLLCPTCHRRWTTCSSTSIPRSASSP